MLCRYPRRMATFTAKSSFLFYLHFIAGVYPYRWLLDRSKISTISIGSFIPFILATYQIKFARFGLFGHQLYINHSKHLKFNFNSGSGLHSHQIQFIVTLFIVLATTISPCTVTTIVVLYSRFEKACKPILLSTYIWIKYWSVLLFYSPETFVTLSERCESGFYWERIGNIRKDF